MEHVCEELDKGRTFGIIWRKGYSEFKDGISIIAWIGLCESGSWRLD